ncbi:MAG: hypothetical protein JXB50_12885 [Spirochaetes bacterium]|nr:hypothetical protein [Spirochaetota bacterium]
MVPNNNNDKILYLSSLDTINNILKEFIHNAAKMKESIIAQNWDNINETAAEQENLNTYFDDAMQKLNFLKSFDNKNDEEISNLKKNIKAQINEYKEKEILNTKLLNDAMYSAKKKVEYFFKKTVKTDTYNKESKKNNKLWDDDPIIYNGFV